MVHLQDADLETGRVIGRRRRPVILLHIPQAPGILIHVPQAPGGRVCSYPSGAGRSLRSLGFRAFGAPARSRRPGRCAARSRLHPTPRVPPGGLVHIPQAPGARSARLAFAPSARRRGRAGRAAARPGPAYTPHPACRRVVLFISLRRRALAPLAWLSRLRRAGAVAPAGPLRGPVPLTPHTPRAAGWSCSYPSGAGRSLRSLGFRAFGAPARSRRPGRCAARSRLHPTPRVPPGGLVHIPQAPGARSARLAYAPFGAPARLRRPGRCAARSRSSPISWGAPSGPDGPAPGTLRPRRRRSASVRAPCRDRRSRPPRRTSRPPSRPAAGR